MRIRVSVMLLCGCTADPLVVMLGDGSLAPDVSTDSDGGGVVLPPDGQGCRGETCNGFDDDCDGLVDDDVPGAGATCGDSDIGECARGAEQCVSGQMICVGAVGPSFEACDGLDNDCDADADEIYDFQTDVDHCGGCAPCAPENAIPACESGECQVASCEPGWTDLDGESATGCEYECEPTGPEVCDGRDNDCNGPDRVDEADPGFIGLSENPCSQLGACAGATYLCAGDAGWLCLYPAGACPTCAEICDGLDNDCDVAVDETFGVGDPCDDGEIGRCRGTGAYVCNDDATGVECVITSLGEAEQAETCNGLDDDCDGETDEYAEVVDDIVNVVRGGLDFWIYRYEASRPGATASAPGVFENRACSQQGVKPWASVDWSEASAACDAAGMRLCTAAQWRTACETPTSTTRYPYGSTYGPTTCNGDDYGEGAARSTGTLAACISEDDVYDLSGNLKEWTLDPVSDGALPDPDGYRTRGGSYDNSATGLACDFTFTVLPPDFAFDNLGFRCCCTPVVDPGC
ncbi:MAG: MopE-related protein [Myxococcota bacterium]